MKTTNLSHLTEQEQEAIATCVNRMYAELNDCIYATILFGSKARGNDTADSDIDLLVVTATNDWQVDQTLRGIAAEVSLEYDVLFNTHIIGHERWADMERRRATYWRNVQRDGIELMPDERRKTILEPAGLISPADALDGKHPEADLLAGLEMEHRQELHEKDLE